MGYKSKLAVLVISYFMSIYLPVYGQEDLNSKMLQHMEKSEQEYAKRSKEEKKLRYGMFEILRDAEAADTSLTARKDFKNRLKFDKKLNADDQDRVRIHVKLKSMSEVPNMVEFIKGLEGIIEKTYKTSPYIGCRVHPKKFRQIASQNSVMAIDPVVQGQTRSIVSAGDRQLKADSVRAQFGAYGGGVKVGVISDGVDHITAVQSNGELPYVNIIDRGKGNEGTAMLEIIHDLAPNASLYFYGDTYSFLSLAEAIDELKRQGCRIIVDDIVFVDEPYFSDEDADLGRAIRDFSFSGGLYVSAAGNNNYHIDNINGRSIYSGSTNIGPNNLNIFKNNQTTIDFYIYSDGSGEVGQEIWLEWATSWNSPVSDYDLYVYDENGNPITESIIPQSISEGNPPREHVYVVNRTVDIKLYRLSIKFKSGNYSATDFKLICYPTQGFFNNQYTDNRHIFGHIGYPNVLSVAAYQADAQNILAPYSSGGPLKMYSEVSGQWTDNQVPSITATSNVSTFVGSNGYWKRWNSITQDSVNNNPFSGTSAAAPHIAAIAALYFSQYPARNRDQFIDDLKNSAVTIDSKGGNGTWNARAGYGKVDALACLRRAAPVLPQIATPIFSVPGGNYASAFSLTITCATSGAQIRYTDNGSTPIESSTLYSPSTPIQIASSKTIRAKAFKSGMTASDVTSATYNFIQGVTLAQVDENNVPFDSVAYYYPANHGWNYVKPNQVNDWINAASFLASQNFKTGTTQKYNMWYFNGNPISDRNWFDVNLPSGQKNYVARFKSSHNAKIQNLFEGFTTISEQKVDTIYFSDPWLVDDSSYTGGKGPRNRGTNATLKKADAPLEPKTNSFYKGVFLNQPIATNKPYYSVKAPISQTINLGTLLGTRNFYFQYWDYTGAQLSQVTPNPSGYDQKAIFFTAPNATVSAVYKSSQLSNNVNAYTNNSQRKFVRSDDGVLHQVYESMGHVWYEMSTNNGSTWQIANGGKPLDTDEGRSPSICTPYLNNVVIVFQNFNIGTELKTQYFNNGMLQAEDIIAYYGSYIEFDPVIDFGGGRILVVWKDNTLHYKLGDYSITDHFRWFNTGVVPNTDQNSGAVSIAGTLGTFLPGGSYHYGGFHIVWEHINEIRYIRMNVAADGSTIQFSDYGIPSTGSGYLFNYSPSITELIQNGYFVPKVLWIGRSDSPAASKAVFRDYYNSSWSPFFKFDSNIESVSINNTADNNYAIGWSTKVSSTPTYANKYVRNTSFSNIKTFNTTGRHIQLNNGGTYSTLFNSSFNNKSAPYYFTTSNSVGSIGKENTITTAFGRESIISNDSTALIFSISDIVANGENIEFNEIADTASVKNREDLNTYLNSQPFTLNDNSGLSYNIQYGLINPDVPFFVKGNDKAEFSIELIDNSTGEVMDVLNSFTFNIQNQPEYETNSFSINTSGIGNKTVRLRVILEDNIEPLYSLSSIYAEEEVIAKSSSTLINFEGGQVITEYNLKQNYPNPFNPTTTITYQLPKDGMVSLKIYDAIGKEVTTLVNEYKTTGSYNIQFNASNLASGVYFYKLNVNDYSATKKLILMK